ncbi:protein of unknown function [Hyphomicrobium sp. MC1]|nr:protein of unknown function [Hyphomicrobium sp. MC1]
MPGTGCASLQKWHVYHVWCADWIPPHYQYCICVCTIREWFLFINSEPPQGRKARAYAITISNHETHFLKKPESHTPTAPNTFADDRVAKALENPDNDLGKLAPFLIGRIKCAVETNPSLTDFQRLVMLSDDPVPLN